GLGLPLIGQLSEGAFHPATWLYALLPTAAALRWEVLLGPLLAAAGQFLLTRRLGLSRTASVFSAVAFAFSGYAFSMSGCPLYLWGLATLPWLGLCTAA